MGCLLFEVFGLALPGFGFGTRFDVTPGLLYFFTQFVPAGDLIGQFVASILLPVCLLSLLHQRFNVLLKQSVQLFGALVSEVFVFAGVGTNVSAVNSDGAQLKQLEFPSQFKDFNKTSADGRLVGITPTADRIVIGVGAAGEIAHIQVPVAGPLYFARAENAVAVTVD